MANTTDIELGNIDSDKSIAIEIKHDDKIPEDDLAYVQVLCTLYSTQTTIPYIHMYCTVLS